MKKKFSIIGGMICLLVLTSCARETHYVRATKYRQKKTIVLPETGADRGYTPYVVNGERYYPLPDAEGFVQFGKASWYGKDFHGRPTSSGEIFDMHERTAAHKTLPLGTYVKVTNLSNQKDVVVRINDRGPFVKGRIIDLSYAAAKGIGLTGPGTAEVKIIALGKEVEELKTPSGVNPVIEVEDLKTGEFSVQVGAFKNKENATRLADRLRVIFEDVEVAIFHDRDRGTMYRVWVSKSKTLTEASEVEKKLEEMGFEEAFIVGL